MSIHIAHYFRQYSISNCFSLFTSTSFMALAYWKISFSGVKAFLHILEHMISFMLMVFLACTRTSKYPESLIVLL